MQLKQAIIVYILYTYNLILAVKSYHLGCNHVCNISCPVDIDPCDFELWHQDSSPIKLDALPGIGFWSKSYNFLDGRELWEKHGYEILRFNWNKHHRTLNPNFDFEVPLEFANIPNIVPSCFQQSTITEFKQLSSSEVIYNQDFENSAGFGITTGQIGAILGGTPIGKLLSSAGIKKLGIDIRNSNTMQTKTNRKMQREGFVKVSNIFTKTSMYQGFLDWDNVDKYQLNPEFLFALDELNCDCDFLCVCSHCIHGHGGNKCWKPRVNTSSILKFIYKFGTHVITKARMGAECQESVYVQSVDQSEEFSGFTDYLKKNKRKIIFWKSETDETINIEQSSVWEESIKYEFENIRCSAEFQTTHECGKITGTNLNPKPIEYDAVPIWELSICNHYMTPCIKDSIRSFIANIMFALEICARNNCNNHGICVLRSDLFTYDFVYNQWDGNNFKEFVDYNQECYCDDEWFGANCDEEPPPIYLEMGPDNCVEDNVIRTPDRENWNTDSFKPAPTDSWLLAGLRGRHSEGSFFGLSSDEQRFGFKWCKLPAAFETEDTFVQTGETGTSWTVECPTDYVMRRIVSQWEDSKNKNDRRRYEIQCAQYTNIKTDDCSDYLGNINSLEKDASWGMWSCPKDRVITGIHTSYKRRPGKQNRQFQAKCCKLRQA